METLFNNLVLISIIAIGIVAFFLCKFKEKWNQTPESIQNALTSLGILFTFGGIVYALWQFDVQNIESSIPEFLEGLKTAFISSILGMLLGLGIKSWLQAKEKSEVSSTEPDEQIIALLGEMVSLNKESNERLRKSLAGDGETSVITQLQKLRTTISDQNEEIIKEFRTFAQKMAENNYNALITALKEVIKDFNAKINEQFGENFKHLNEGVGKMLEWQSEYKEQVAVMTNSLESISARMTESSEAMQTVAGKSQKLIEVADNMKNYFNSMEYYEKSLSGMLNSFKTMSNDAEKAFPMIREELDKLTKGMARNVNDFISKSETMIRTQNEAVDSHSKAMKSIGDTVSNETKKMYQEISTQVNTTMKSIEKSLENNIKNMDEALHKDLSNALNTMGNKLAALSKQFVADYSPLTDKLRKVVHLVNGGDYDKAQ